MRRITVWLFSTVAAVVLLFSYRTSTNAAPTGTPSAVVAADTFTGEVVSTQYGPVQVSIVVTGKRITDVQVPMHPSGNKRNDEINARAVPLLREKTLTAQSAAVDTVSGATFTSEGYRKSLQSALDAAHLN